MVSCSTTVTAFGLNARHMTKNMLKIHGKVFRLFPHIITQDKSWQIYWLKEGVVDLQSKRNSEENDNWIWMCACTYVYPLVFPLRILQKKN